jgi:hypothetical protein
VKNKDFSNWFIERAMGAGLFGLGGSVLGFFLGIELLGLILGAIVGWVWTDYKVNRDELPLGGESLEQRDRRIKEEERWRYPDEEDK